MIGRLNGKLLEKLPPQIVVDVQGVGYEVLAPMSTVYHLPEVGQAVILYTHFVVREDGHFLYGFLTEQERYLFRLLIKVNGIGPKIALAILSSLEPQTFMQSILEGDVALLSRTPGVGKKTAERLIVEMKDKLGGQEFSGAFSGSGLESSGDAGHRQDAIEALLALGYKQADVVKKVSELLKKSPQLSSQELIRAVLKQGT